MSWKERSNIENIVLLFTRQEFVGLVTLIIKNFQQISYAEGQIENSVSSQDQM